ncbi:MAG: hypothetical protein ACXWPI_04700 [Ktedonobacterales bacterium]
MGHLLHLTALAQHYARLVTQRLVAGATDPRSVRDELKRLYAYPKETVPGQVCTACENAQAGLDQSS